jgi:6-pyruvoyltetrahydropterin/6-carboxytetrahydropterin synthase
MEKVPRGSDDPVPFSVASLWSHRPNPSVMQRAWSIHIEKDYLKFSSAHFLIFPDGTAERIHGHNYKVFVTVHTELDEHGLVINFKDIKPMIRDLVDELDEMLLIPGKHPELVAEPTDGGQCEIRYRDRFYSIPADEVLVLPVSNTSAENLAGYLADRLLAQFQTRFPGVELLGMDIEVEETKGQRGIVHLRAGERPSA